MTMSSASPSDDALDLLGHVAARSRAQLAEIARREGLGPEDAVDCVHDAYCTFLGLALRGDLPTDEASWPSFLGGVVRNAARNKRRRHDHARPHDALDALEPRADEPSTEALVARAEEHVRLRACIGTLCETQRAVVTMRLLEEQPGEDVAAALGISRAYVDVLLHRAKGSLLACMNE